MPTMLTKAKFYLVIILSGLLITACAPVVSTGSLATVSGPTRADDTPTSVLPDEAPTNPPSELPSSTPTPTPYLVFPPADFSSTQAWVVTGGQVKEISLPELGFNQLDRSPASGKILHSSFFPDQGAGPANLSVGDLWVYDIQSGEDLPIFLEQNIVEAVWAPNGQDFTYLKATENTYELRWRNTNGDDKLLAVDVSPTFSVSPDGQQVAFTRETGYKVGEPGVYIVGVSDGVERRVGSTDRQGSGSISDRPLWSPDGKHLLLPVSHVDIPVRWVLIASDGSRELPLKFGADIPQWYQEQELAVGLWHPNNTSFLGYQMQGMMGPPYGQEIVLADLDLQNGQITRLAPVALGAMYPAAWETAGERAWLITEDGELSLLDLALPKPMPETCKVNEAQLFVNPFKGYCFSYPSDFQIQAFEYERPVFLGPALDQSIEPRQARMWIEANPVPTDTNLQGAIDQFIAGLPAGDPPITRKPASLGGEPAEILENVPGQLFSRVALALHDGVLYQLWFNPVDSSTPQVLPDVQRLYQAVIESFAFLP